MFKLIVTTIFVLLFPSLAVSQEITKEQWVDRMSTALPTMFCQSGQYFRECFRVSQEQCEEVALSATRICLKDKARDMPASLEQPKDGRHWGQIIGECAGTNYEITIIEKRINSAQCNDITNWAQ